MHQNNPIYAVIMAGGGGTRLWPVSRKDNPKQLLALFGGKTLFEIAIERLIGLFPVENILVVTIAEQAIRLKQIAPQIPEQNYLIEPMPRGTAAVVAMGATAIQKRDPEGIMVVLTADHFVENVSAFQSVIKAGCECAKHGHLVTLGIKPSFPSTGYGYIEIGNTIGEFSGQEVYKAIRFEEKPDENRAIDFIKSGNYFWNSGMFIWKAAEILAEFKQHMPSLAESIANILALVGRDHSDDRFLREWAAIKSETIDYGIMEKSDRVVVIPVEDIGWSDVGSWDSLFDVMPADENGNIMLGEHIHPLESKNSLFFSDEKEKMVISLGVQNMIIVNTPDALLICPRGESQKVKMLVEYLKTNHYTLFL
jgi:mannose-1-phosphate guanylyltransferase